MVYVDGSESSFRAVDRAIELADNGAEVTALHVFPPRLDRDVVSQFDFEPEDLDAKFAEDLMSTVRTRFEDAGLRTETVVEEGAVAEVITERAAEGEFDLILVGGRRTTGGKLFDLAEILLQKSSVKVEIV